MRKLLSLLLIGAAALALVSCGGPKKTGFDPEKTAYVTFKTNMGDVTIRLFDDTPLHRDNMIRLVQTNSYDSTIFHRIVKDFVIQGGDLDSRKNEQGKRYGGGDGNYTVPAEILPQYFNRRGAVIDAKMGDDVNPERASAGTQFCFLQGRVQTDEELDRTEIRLNEIEKNWLYHRYMKSLKEENPGLAVEHKKDEVSQRAMKMAEEEMTRRGPITIPADRREIYKTIGGSPHLDGSVTIFGEVIEGFDTMDRMNAVPTNREYPVEPVMILSTVLFNGEGE